MRCSAAKDVLGEVRASLDTEANGGISVIVDPDLPEGWEYSPDSNSMVMCSTCADDDPYSQRNIAKRRQQQGQPR